MITMGKDEARERLWNKFKSIAYPLRRAFVNFTGESSEDEACVPNPDYERVERDVTAWEDANGISSLIRNGLWGSQGNWHYPVLDLDIESLLVPSSRHGHYHLIIAHPMPWESYVRLLEVMRDVGLLEPGFVNASIDRGATWVRTPWAKKKKK